jgi:Kef-type K+ transport system membrane component KefB
MTNSELLLELLLQLTVILSVCRLVSYIGKRYFGQTDVVGEMLAGIMLGPSLFGMIAPELQQWLFPKAPVIVGVPHLLPNPSMSILYTLSQIGLIQMTHFHYCRQKDVKILMNSEQISKTLEHIFALV